MVNSAQVKRELEVLNGKNIRMSRLKKNIFSYIGQYLFRGHDNYTRETSNEIAIMPLYLTHFRLIFHLSRNQVVGFYY